MYTPQHIIDSLLGVSWTLRGDADNISMLQQGTIKDALNISGTLGNIWVKRGYHLVVLYAHLKADTALCGS